MGENSKIEWCDHTFNPWWGCQRVSPGCEHCYAETFDKRIGGSHWGPQSARRFFGAKHWDEPLKWHAAAVKAGKLARVFCASMADVFEDRRDLDGERAKLWQLIEGTPMLEWLLLTKRPQNVLNLVPGEWNAAFPPNVRVGTTVEDTQRLNERLPHLLRIPAKNFLSMEPLLEHVSLRWLPAWPDSPRGAALSGGNSTDQYDGLRRINWVIPGGESGGGSRPCNVAWIRSIVCDCVAAGVPVLVKQLGSNVRDRNDAGFDGCTLKSWPEAIEERDAIEDDPNGYREDWQGAEVRIRLIDKKGGDMAEWPLDLRLRQFPGADQGGKGTPQV